MCNVDGNAHVRKVEAVAQPNERQRHHMVRHQLLVVLARLLEAKKHHNALLRPIRRLEEVVELEGSLVRAVRKILVHAGRVKVPDGATAHHINTRRAHAAKVDGRVHLLGEAHLLALALDAVDAAQRDEQLLHHQLAGKRQHHCVKGHKGNVPEPLAIVYRQSRVKIGLWIRLLVRQKDEVADGVGLGWVDGISGSKDDEQHQGNGPSVSHGEARKPSQQRPGLSPLLAVRREARGRAIGRGSGSFGSSGKLLMLPLAEILGLALANSLSW